MSNEADPNEVPLEIIERELDYLNEKSHKQGLTLDDTKKFDILVKCRQVLTERALPIDDSLSDYDDMSNEDLIKLIKNGDNT